MNLGVAGFFQTALYARERDVTNVAQLLQDSRWPWRPNLYEYETLPPKVRTRKDKALKRDESERLAAGLRAGDRSQVMLMSAPTAAVVRCMCTISTGREGPRTRGSYVYTACQLGGEWPAPTSVEAWVELQHEVFVACRMTSGVLFAWPEWSDTTADAFFTTRSNPDEQDARLRDENEAMGMHFGSRLGKEYVRAPRWGTYLSKAWLDRIGGVDAVRREVAPAAIRDLGGDESLVFVQLTTSVADALSPEADAKRIALRRLMKPILPTPFL